MALSFNVKGITSKDIPESGGGSSSGGDSPQTQYNRSISIIPYLSAEADKGFVVSSNKEFAENYPLLYCFDGTSSIAGYTASGISAANPLAITIECDKPYRLRSYIIGGSSNNTHGPTEWFLQASNDKIVWDLLDIAKVPVFEGRTSIQRDATFTGRAYKYFKIVMTKQNETHLHIDKIELCGDADNYTKPLTSVIPTFYSADTRPEGYNVTCSSEYKAASCVQALFCKGIFNDTSLIGAGSKSNAITGTLRWLSGLTAAELTMPQWVQIELPEPVTINSYLMVKYWYNGQDSTEPTRNPKSYEFQGSNDGKTYTTLDSVTNLPTANGTNLYGYRALAEPATYKFYRILITGTQGSGHGTHIAGLDLFKDKA